MKKLMLLLLAGFACTNWLNAQELIGVCGNSMEDQLQYDHRLLANLEKVDAGLISDRGVFQYVPVYFHLVGDAAGNGKIKERFVLDQLCALNAAYEPANIQFYLRPHPTKGLFNYDINATNVYSNQDGWFTMHTNRHPNAMNIYIVDAAVSGNNQPGETQAYYSPTRDWVVCKKSQIGGSTSNIVLPHELGHFFSLDHTFLGWESDPFDPTDPSWPVAPFTSPGGLPTERMNGTNCTTAADKICDTPPDYNFGFGNSSCSYTAGAKDPNGTEVVTMPDNWMGYFFSCTDYTFTPQQQNVIIADLNSSARNYLDNTFSPLATEINTPSNLLVSPANGITMPYYDEVLVEWQDMPEASYYLLEFDIVNTYISPFAQSFIVNSNSKLVTTLAANRTYYWRVRPFNQYVTCAAPRQQSFKTSSTSGVQTIDDLTAWQVAPNPIQGGATARIFTQAKNGFEANIMVFDATGRQVYEQTGVLFPSGEHAVDLPLGNLGNGIYAVMLQAQEGLVSRKISVLK